MLLNSRPAGILVEAPPSIGPFGLYEIASVRDDNELVDLHPFRRPNGALCLVWGNPVAGIGSGRCQPPKAIHTPPPVHDWRPYLLLGCWRLGITDRSRSGKLPEGRKLTRAVPVLGMTAAIYTSHIAARYNGIVEKESEDPTLSPNSMTPLIVFWRAAITDPQIWPCRRYLL